MLEPWQVMWGLAVLIYAACKWVTWREAGAPVSRRGLGYLLAWPGLDARAFLDRTRVVGRPARGEWALAIANTGLGLIAFSAVAPRLPVGRPGLVGWAGMIGLVLALHFGLFHLLSCGWRAVGVAAEPLMNWPIAAVGLGDFWGRRWNTAFRDLAHRFVFRPILRRTGPGGGAIALFASFLGSGLVHDAVISIPAGSGYGLPTLYFLAQAAGLQGEARLRRRGWLPGWRGRIYAAAFLLLPIPWLFHEPFVHNVHRPLHEGIGGHRMRVDLGTTLFLCGLAQFGILAASALVPFRLDWKRELACLSPLHRQMYWVYGGYVVLNIVAFGVISTRHAGEIAAGGPLARSFAGYVATFWGIRLALQAVFDVEGHLTTWWLRLGYRALTALFLLLAACYGYAAFHR